MIKVERVMFSGDVDEGVINPLDLRGAVSQMYQDLRDGIIKRCTFVDLALCEEETVEFGDLFDEA